MPLEQTEQRRRRPNNTQDRPRRRTKGPKHGFAETGYSCVPHVRPGRVPHTTPSVGFDYDDRRAIQGQPSDLELLRTVALERSVWAFPTVALSPAFSSRHLPPSTILAPDVHFQNRSILLHTFRRCHRSVGHPVGSRHEGMVYEGWVEDRRRGGEGRGREGGGGEARRGEQRR